MVEDEPLADLLLGVADAVVGVERQADDLDRDADFGAAIVRRLARPRTLIVVLVGGPHAGRTVAAATPAHRAPGDVVDAKDAGSALQREHARGDRGRDFAAPRSDR